MTYQELVEKKAEITADTTLASDDRKLQLRQIRAKIRKCPEYVAEHPVTEPAEAVEGEEGAEPKPKKEKKAPSKRSVRTYAAPKSITLDEAREYYASIELPEVDRGHLNGQLVHGVVFFAGTTAEDGYNKAKEVWPNNDFRFFTVLQTTDSTFTLGYGPIPQEAQG